MRILHFLPVYIPAWQFGGPILSVSRLCEGLSLHGVDVRVITTNAGLSDSSSLNVGETQNINGVHVTYYQCDHKKGPVRSRALIDALPDHMAWADILHLSSIWQPLGIAVQKAAHVAGVPVIQTLRGALSPYSWSRSLHKKLPYYFLKENRLLQRADLIHCTTHQELMETKWLRLKPPTRILPNPLELSSLYTDNYLRYTWRRKYNIPMDATLFIVAGRLHHKKGLDLLPQVLKMSDDESFHLLVIGDDDDGSGLRLRQRLDQYGFLNRCHWIGSLPSKELLGPLNSADWLLLPSRHENFGNIVVEALSCGCGVILSDRVGVGDMLVECPGVLSGCRTPEAWTRMVDVALKTPRPGQLSESWVKERFSQVVIAKEAIQMYRQLIQ